MSKKQKEEDLDFEIRFYEGILGKKGDFLQALMALGDLYTKKGLYQQGLEIDRKLSQMRPEDPYILYNLACSYSLLNQIDLALSAMKLAIKCGYHDLRFLEQDADLANLKKDPRFQTYLVELRNKKPKQA